MSPASGPVSKSARDPLPPASRYECLLKIASGGMASVHVGRLRGRHGFSRLVAIKRAHPDVVEQDPLRAGLIAEARLASRIHHPNVVSVLDIDEPPDELLLVMDYVEGAALAQLVAAGPALPPAVIVRIALDVCAGLHAAHELRADDGDILGIVHCDVSPQNILVGVDGVARIADFGVAKGSRADCTTAGLKGKFAYMAPEYIRERQLDRRSDLFGLGVVLWEALTARRLFRGTTDQDCLQLVLDHDPPTVSSVAPWVPRELDEPIARALAKVPEDRHATAALLAEALASAARRAGLDPNPSAVSSVVRERFGALLDERRSRLHAPSGAARAAGASGEDALVAERTATAEGTFSADDARTAPLPRRARPPQTSSGNTANGIVTEPPPPPKPSWRGRVVALALPLCAGAGAGALALGALSSADTSVRGIPVPVAGEASANDVISRPPVERSAPARTLPPPVALSGPLAAPADAFSSRPTVESRPTARPRHRVQAPVVMAPDKVEPSPSASSGPADTSTRPRRPGLGY